MQLGESKGKQYLLLQFRQWSLGLLLLSFNFLVTATTVGRPPITEIQLPAEPYITYFDMAQDHQNVIYLAYDNGVKIFDGYHWQTLLIPDTYVTRSLYFDQKDRVYVGGYDFFGYILKNAYGHYDFIDLTPKKEAADFASIWQITSCLDHIYFRALNDVFEFNPANNQVISWNFDGRLGSILCHGEQLLLQDRSVGMKELVNGDWQDSIIELEDNSLIFNFRVLDNQQVFIRSLSDNWRIIEDKQIKPVNFDTELPELGSYATSMTLDNNKVLMGGKDGVLTFLDFNNFKAESFKISSDWIASIKPAHDGGIFILSNFKVYHLSWPTPWRIQDNKTGLSSDLFDMTFWNDELYVTSRAGVFVEDPKQINNNASSFRQLDWTPQEAWNLMPLNDSEILLAESHHISLISKNNKKHISEVIYPRVFQKSKFHINQIIVHTELDTRLLLSDQGWSDWIIAEGKPNGVVELSEDTLLVTTIGGTYQKITYDFEQRTIIDVQDLTQSAAYKNHAIEKLKLHEGPDNQVIATTMTQYYWWQDEQLIETDLYGLATVLPPQELSLLGLEADGTFWAASATKVFIMETANQWFEIDSTPYLQGGLYDVEFINNQIKLSANSVILSYLLDEPNRSLPPNGTLMITAAKLNNPKNNEWTDLPINSKKPIIIEPKQGDLTFQFAYTDIKDTLNIRYQYRVVGYTNQWSAASHNTEANFLGLPPGEYAFQVRAIDSQGGIHTSTLLPFIIDPIWYQTKWAQFLWAMCFLTLFIFTLSFYLRWREKRHEYQKQALKSIINEKTQALKLANQALQDLAHKDSLTGLANRLFLDKYINQLIKTSSSSIAVLMLDIDHFKRYNDSHGHLAGDQLLEQFAQSLSASVTRKVDLVARYGGEEFLVILPDVDQPYAQNVAETIRQNTHQKNNISVSVGVILSENSDPITDAKEVFNLIDAADKALYHAKASGRNRVVMFDELVV